MSILQINHVTKRYENTIAVNDVSFSAQQGRLFGLLGPNGAGKTSTIRMITYITTPDAGEITFQDKAVGSWSQEKMGYMPEERGLYKKMKIGEQLEYLAMLKGMKRAEAHNALNYWLERFDAIDWRNKKPEELSKGMQQKVQFIATIAHDPDLLIFDEPFSGLDPINAELLREVILELKNKGKTILFASHRMEQVEQMCDDICLYSQGKAILAGELRQIKKLFGRNTVVVEFEGDASFVDQLAAQPNFTLLSRTHTRAEFRVQHESEARHILEAAMQHTFVSHFALQEPSLNEIFIQTIEKSLREVK